MCWWCRNCRSSRTWFHFKGLSRFSFCLSFISSWSLSCAGSRRFWPGTLPWAFTSSSPPRWVHGWLTVCSPWSFPVPGRVRPFAWPATCIFFSGTCRWGRFGSFTWHTRFRVCPIKWLGTLCTGWWLSCTGTLTRYPPWIWIPLMNVMTRREGFSNLIIWAIRSLWVKVVRVVE